MGKRQLNKPVGERRMSVRILVVDDDADWRNLLSGELCQAGFEVTRAATGAKALACIQAAHFDLIILDVQLPDGDGYQICSEIRKCECYVPIIMISGVKKEDVDHEFGLDSGADHYFKKPVSVRVVAAQVRAMLNMASALKNEEAAGLSQPSQGSNMEVQWAPLQLDFVKGEFKRGDQRLALTALEIKLLACLSRNPGQLVTAVKLLQAGWREQSPDEKALDSLKSAIKRLRQKIEPDSKHPRYLVTVRGVGYYLCLDPKPD